MRRCACGIVATTVRWVCASSLVYRTYRSIFWWERALRHVVLPKSQSLRGTRREFVRPLLWYEQGLALLPARYVSAQEREELVSQYSFDTLEGVR